MRILTVICSVGFIFSIGGVVSTTSQYKVLSYKGTTIELLSSDKEKISQSVNHLLDGHRNKEQVMKLLDISLNKSDMLHSLVINMNTDSINFTLYERWAWIISSVTFALLIVLIELGEKLKSKIKSVWSRTKKLQDK